MNKILPISLLVLLTGLFTGSVSYAERECSRTVTCSDGTTLITTICSDSYQIIDGKIYDGDSDDPDNPWRHHHHHGNPPPDPCTEAGHGHLMADPANATS